MMEGMMGVFQTLLKMSLTGSTIICIVLALRQIFRRAPKKCICLLWLAVCFRLLCPVTAEGPIPDLWTVTVSQSSAGSTALPAGLPWGSSLQGVGGPTLPEPDLQGNGLPHAGSGKGTLDASKGTQEKQQDGQTAGTYPSGLLKGFFTWFVSLSVWEMAGFICGIIWAAGTAVFSVYGILHYRKMSVKLKTAAKLPDRIRETEYIQTPMVYGILHPCIYLPKDFRDKVEEQEYGLILRHEQMHISRRDYLIKAAAYAVLCIHWWNPLVWLAVLLWQKDMEMACDEAVMADAEEDIRQAYAGALLHFSMQRSGLLSYVAFGESNTENRIRNILKYKKRPLFVSIGILAVIAAVFVCLVTKPHTVEENTGTSPTGESGEEPGASSGGTEDVIYLEDGTAVYSSLEQMRQIYQARWESLLDAQGVVKKGSAVVTFGMTGIDEEILKTENDKPLDLEGEFTFYTVQEDYRVTIYKTKVTYRVKDGSIYVSHEEDNAYEKVTTAEEAWGQGVMPLYYLERKEDGQLEVAGFWDKLEETALLSSSNHYRDMLEPGKAAAFLLHLEGGTCEILGHTEQGAYVLYTFADGSRTVYNMQRVIPTDGRYRDVTLWLPAYIASEEQTERIITVHSYLEATTAEELKKVTEEVNYSDMGWMELEDRFVLLDNTAGRDIALYGLYGGDAMVLRDGDMVYPLHMYWTSPQMRIPEVYASDYDGDQAEEYAIFTYMGTGTGYSVGQLYMIESLPTGSEVREFAYGEICSQLERITYDWNKVYNKVRFFTDGEDTGQDLSLKNMLEAYGMEFEDIVFGEMIQFEERDGQWYLLAKGGVKLKDSVMTGYEASVDINAPVIYSEDGRFFLGDITLAVNQYEVSEEEEWEEKTVNTLYADITHDGVEDVIVTSVAAPKGEELLEEGRSAEEILSSNTAMCYIRVYDGSLLQYAYDGKSYDTGYALWERELSQAHVGNGMVFLTKKEGLAYLVDSTAWLGQGAGSYAYSVFYIDAEKGIYEEDQRQVDFDTNAMVFKEDPEMAFPAKDMLTYTEKFAKWVDGQILIAKTDVDGGPRISTPEGNASMEAWEIWQQFVMNIDRTLSGMEDIQETLEEYYYILLDNYDMPAQNPS